MLSSRTLGARLKCELFQRTGSFKPRGALNKLASLDDGREAPRRDHDLRRQPRPGGRLRRRASTESTRSSSCGRVPRSRRSRRPASYGATVDLEATEPRRGLRPPRRAASSETGRMLVHPFDDPFVLAGAGTVGARDRGGRARCRRRRRPGRRRRADRRDRRRAPSGRPIRVIAVEPETSPALARRRSPPASPSRRRRARSPTASTPRSSARLRSSSAATSSASSSPRRRSRTRFRFLYERAKLAVRAGRAPSRPPRILAGKIDAERARSPSSAAATSAAQTASDILASTMKADIHPDYVFATVHCSCGNSFTTRSTSARAERRDLLAVPPVLHGQAEARGHRRARRALPAAAREGRPRGTFDAPPSHGTGDRRPGRPRGRHDARSSQLGGRRAQARRRDRPRRPHDRPARDAPLDAAPPGRPRRRRARRVARDRLPRPLGLRELRRAGCGRGRPGARGDRPLDAVLLLRGRDRLRAHALQGRPGAPRRHAADQRRLPVRASSRA